MELSFASSQFPGFSKLQLLVIHSFLFETASSGFSDTGPYALFHFPFPLGVFAFAVLRKSEDAMYS